MAQKDHIDRAAKRGCEFRMRRYWTAFLSGVWLFGTVMLLPAAPTTRTWSGPARGLWSTAANWTPNDAAPQDGDTAIVASGSVRLTGDSALLASLTVTNATLICSNWTTRIRATNVLIRNNGTITTTPFGTAVMSNRVYIVCSNLTVYTGGKINLLGCGYKGTNGATAHGLGPGKGYYQRGGGGGHGGRGGYSYLSAAGGVTYGSLTAPSTPGSSGSGGGNTEGAGGGGVLRVQATGAVQVDGLVTVAGGNGNPWGTLQSGCGAGGSIWINCARFGGNGQVLAEGGTGAAYGSGSGGAGGGGRIAIYYGSLIAAPTVRISAAPGWDGREFATTRDFPSQGIGSSGYGQDARPGTLFLSSTGLLSSTISKLSGYLTVSNVAVWATTGLTVSNTAFGFGPGTTVTVAGNALVTGTSGVLLSDTGCPVNVSGNMELRNGGRLELQSDLTCGGSLSVLHAQSHVVMKGRARLRCGGDFILQNSGAAYFHGSTNVPGGDYSLLVDVTNEISLTSGSWIYPYSGFQHGGTCRFRAGAMTVVAGSGFNADGKGWGGPYGGNGYGPGRGIYSGGGAGYGGKGGETSWGANRDGGAYGSSNAPLAAGSGGAGHPNSPMIAAGGGLVRVEVRGPLLVDGTVTARGSSGSLFFTDMRGGCGSGGGIFVRCGTISGGTGAWFRADGGSGADTGASALTGGGGGGGRVAVWYAVPEGRVTGIISGTNMYRVETTNRFKHFRGRLSATNGTGYVNTPPDGAEPGTSLFLTIRPLEGTLLKVM